MNARGAILQGALAVVGLGGMAWVTWQPAEKATGDVVVLDAGKNDVSLVRFSDDKTTVELSRKRDGADAGVWIKLAANAEKKTPEREVRGNEAAERLFDSFAPLRATRSLGTYDESKLKEFGLAAPDVPDGGAAKNAPVFHKRTIEVTARGDKRTFAAGTPPGGYTTYLRDERDGRVYVIGGTLLSDLEAAGTRMVERGMHQFKVGDFDEVVVESGGKKRDLVVLNPEQTYNSKLASKKAPDKPDETAKNWETRVFAMYPVEVLGKGEVPAAGAPEVKAKVTWLSHGSEKGWVELAKVQPPATKPPPPPAAQAGTSAPPPAAPPAEYYARTERTAGWVKLSAVTEDLLKDADKIAAAE